MHLHRLTTHNLPSIRIYDQNSMDTASDHHSSSTSQRSMPREIPIPKNGSPTSSRGGSFHGSVASPAIPPILSLEPPGLSLPPPNYHTFRRPDSISSIGEESGSEGLRPRKVVLDIRNRERERWKLSPIGKSIDEQDLSGSRDGFSIRSEDSFDRNWREDFYSKVDERASPQESVNPMINLPLAFPHLRISHSLLPGRDSRSIVLTNCPENTDCRAQSLFGRRFSNQ